MPPPSGVAGFRRGGRRAPPPSGAGLLSGGRGLGSGSGSVSVVDLIAEGGVLQKTLTVFVIHQKTPNCFPLAFFFSFAETLAPSERLRPWTGPPVAHFEAPGPHPNENKLAAHRLYRRTHALLSSPLIGKGSKRFSSMLQVAATRMLAREESP